MVQDKIDTIITTAKLLNYTVDINKNLYNLEEVDPNYKTSIIIQIWVTKIPINIFYDLNHSNDITSLLASSNGETTNQEEMIVHLNKILKDLI